MGAFGYGTTVLSTTLIRRVVESLGGAGKNEFAENVVRAFCEKKRMQCDGRSFRFEWLLPLSTVPRLMLSSGGAVHRIAYEDAKKPIRLVIVSSPSPQRLDAGEDESTFPKTFDAREKVIGEVAEWGNGELDGESFAR